MLWRMNIHRLFDIELQDVSVLTGLDPYPRYTLWYSNMAMNNHHLQMVSTLKLSFIVDFPLPCLITREYILNMTQPVSFARRLRLLWPHELSDSQSHSVNPLQGKSLVKPTILLVISPILPLTVDISYIYNIISYHVMSCHVISYIIYRISYTIYRIYHKLYIIYHIS